MKWGQASRIAFLVLVLSSCAENRQQHARVIADGGHLQLGEVVAAPFRITVFSRISRPDEPVDVYIEGDGAAWSSISEPSLDPTPRKALGLKLAAMDPAANVIYLARPCQLSRHDPACQEAYWTDRRFSQEVIESMNEALDKSLSSLKSRHLHLVGYSGGGAVAVLIAARRHDVLSLTSIAGNLDPTALGIYHDVSPLTGSLDPMAVAPALSHIPQRHFVGGEDEVVPAFVAENFVKALSSQSCVEILTVPRVSHEAGWEQVWAAQVASKATCH